MAIDTLKNKNSVSYRVRVLLPNGKRSTRCFSRMVDAKQWEAQVRTKPHTFAQRKRMKFCDLAQMFLENHAKPNYEFSTFQKYNGGIQKYLIPYFENLALPQILLKLVEWRLLFSCNLSVGVNNFFSFEYGAQFNPQSR